MILSLKKTYKCIDFCDVLKIRMDDFDANGILCSHEQTESREQMSKALIAHSNCEVSCESLLNLHLDEHIDQPLSLASAKPFKQYHYLKQ